MASVVVVFVSADIGFVKAMLLSIVVDLPILVVSSVAVISLAAIFSGKTVEAIVVSAVVALVVASGVYSVAIVASTVSAIILGVCSHSHHG